MVGADLWSPAITRRFSKIDLKRYDIFQITILQCQRIIQYSSFIKQKNSPPPDELYN